MPPDAAIGTLYNPAVDQRLIEVATFYEQDPGSLRARVALGQDYLRYGCHELVLDWLNGQSVPSSETEIYATAQHTRMYAAFLMGNYRLIGDIYQQISQPNHQHSNLYATSLLFSGDFARSQEILNGIPATPEVAINQALLAYQTDQDLTPECSRSIRRSQRDDERERCQESTIIQARQARARQLLNPHQSNLVAQNNLAILDILANDFQSAYQRMTRISGQVASQSSADPSVLQLKQSSLWYVNNYALNIEYLRREQLPLDILQAATIDQLFGFLGFALSGGSLSINNLGSLIQGTIEDAARLAAQQQRVDQVTAQIRANFLNQVNFIVVADQPALLSVGTPILR